MVTVNVGDACGGSQRHALLAEIIVFRCDAVRHLVVIADVIGRNAIDRFLDAVAVAVVLA
jgi:hypothetical protein